MAEPRHLGNDAGGRDGDAPLRDGEPVAVGQDGDRVAHRFEIVERLAHAHEDDVRHRAHALALGREPVGRSNPAGKIAEPVAGDEHLPDDLGGGQIAHQRHRAGMAKRAVEGAADLARDAERAPVGFGNVDAFDLRALVEAMRGRHAQEPLARAVGGDLLGSDLRPRERIAVGELLEQRPGDVAHRREIARAAMVDPVPELGGAHLELALRHADFGERMAEFRAGRPSEAHGRGVLGFEGGGGHGPASSMSGASDQCQLREGGNLGMDPSRLAAGIAPGEFVELRFIGEPNLRVRPLASAIREAQASSCREGPGRARFTLIPRTRRWSAR